MVFEHECTALILKEFPEFEKSTHWKEHLEFWKGEEPGIGNEMAVFGDFVEDEVLNKKNPVVEAEKVFKFIEMLLNEGDKVVQDVAATCFLENLINYTSWGDLDPYSFIKYLGPESKDYCKGWDEFTGVRTPGLWSDEEWEEVQASKKNS